MDINQIELLSPAGDFETALAAFDAGADAVYCGLADFSARAFAKNLSEDELRSLVRFARAKDKKVYVTFNTVVDEDAIEDAVETLSRIEEIGPDAVIVQDIGIARICRRHFPGLVLHASTQLVAHNLEGVLALKEIGFSRIVLARELSIAEISSISRRCGGLELECFIHGALCYSLSGLCLFGAMEKGRSGNRGQCPYCCRMAYGKSAAPYIFSMKDLRLGEDVQKLVDAGVVSLKIEGRMKSALYVAAVTRYYRQILGGTREGASYPKGRRVTPSDLETIFSRRTTELYLDGRTSAPSPIDPVSLGHLGARIGSVKRVTKDREGRSWIRFHTLRALEVHDGLQFDAMVDGRHLGCGIHEMRQAISRTPVFEVAAGTDVEVLLPSEGGDGSVWDGLRPGEAVYCSMSNAVKRMFPVPHFRPSDCRGLKAVDIEISIAADEISARAGDVKASVTGTFTSAKNPEKTYAAVEKAFSKLGETDYSLGRLSLVDPDRRFVPMSVLNDLRRALVERLDNAHEKARREKVDAALSDESGTGRERQASTSRRVLKIRAEQKVPAGNWDEIVVAVDSSTNESLIHAFDYAKLRLALPVYTTEPDFGKLRVLVKRLHRAGYERWEASDLATLRLLRFAGIEDITADWSLYAFNSRALAALSDLGARRFVASPENTRENLQYLAESGYDVEFLVQQSTPLFMSLTKPAGETPEGLSVYRRGELWVTTRPVPRTFDVPRDEPSRVDLSWNSPL